MASRFGLSTYRSLAKNTTPTAKKTPSTIPTIDPTLLLLVALFTMADTETPLMGYSQCGPSYPEGQMQPTCLEQDSHHLVPETYGCEHADDFVSTPDKTMAVLTSDRRFAFLYTAERKTFGQSNGLESESDTFNTSLPFHRSYRKNYRGICPPLSRIQSTHARNTFPLR